MYLPSSRERSRGNLEIFQQQNLKSKISSSNSVSWSKSVSFGLGKRWRESSEVKRLYLILGLGKSCSYSNVEREWTFAEPVCSRMTGWVRKQEKLHWAYFAIHIFVILSNRSSLYCRVSGVGLRHLSIELDRSFLKQSKDLYWSWSARKTGHQWLDKTANRIQSDIGKLGDLLVPNPLDWSFRSYYSNSTRITKNEDMF